MSDAFSEVLRENFSWHKSGRVLVVCVRCGGMVPITHTVLHDEWHDSLVLEGEIVEGELISDVGSPEPTRPEIEEKP